MIGDGELQVRRAGLRKCAKTENVWNIGRHSGRFGARKAARGAHSTQPHSVNTTDFAISLIRAFHTRIAPVAPLASMSKTRKSIVKIEHSQLGISEPNPAWFGNAPNRATKEWDSETDNWLKSRFHFNFAEWHGGRNRFGALRVMNDDLVQPARGFGTHPHRNAEIM